MQKGYQGISYEGVPYKKKCLVSVQQDKTKCLQPKVCDRNIFEDKDINIFQYGGHKAPIRHRVLATMAYTNKVPTQCTDFFLTRCMAQETTLTNCETENENKLTLKSQLENYFDKQFYETVKIVPINTSRDVWRIHIRQYLLPEKLRPKYDPKLNTHNALSRYYRLEQNLGKERHKQKLLNFHQEVGKLIKEGIWVKLCPYEDLKETLETSTPEDPIFYCVSPLHLVDQPGKDSHKIRITLDFKSSVNSLYFQGKLLLPRLELTTTAWYLSKNFICMDIKRFFFRVGVLQPQTQLLFYRENCNEKLYLYKHTRLVMGSLGSSNHSTNALNYGAQMFDKLFPPGQPHRCGQVPEMQGARPSSLYLDLTRQGGPLDPRTCLDLEPMEEIIKTSSYADNIFLFAQDAQILKERFFRVYMCLKLYDMDVHEIFSNNSELLQELVSESEKVNVTLDLHPSLVLKTTSPRGGTTSQSDATRQKS